MSGTDDAAPLAAGALAPIDPPPRDRSPAAVYLASLGSKSSRRSMRCALETIAAELGVPSVETLSWAAIRYQHAQAIRARLAARLSPASVNKTLSALRGVLREAMRLGLISAEDCARACDVPAVRGSRLPAGRALGPGELRALFAAVSTSAQGARDAALVAVLYGCGLRRSEAVSLDLAHRDRDSLKVRGKGNKERVVYLPPGSQRALDAWLKIRGASPGPLFSSVDRAGRVTMARLADGSVSFVLKRLAKRAGVAAFSPHDLRRTFVGDALDAGADLATVQALAGHASITTTQRYDRRGERAKQRAAAMLHVPT
jgi:site-specific recombinase XerD